MVVLCAARTYHDMSGSRSLRLSKSAEESNLLLDALSASGSNIDMVPQIRRTERLLSRVLQNSATTKLLNSFANPYFRQGFDGYTLPFLDPITILFTSLVPRLSHASLFQCPYDNSRRESVWDHPIYILPYLLTKCSLSVTPNVITVTPNVIKCLVTSK